MKRTLLFLSVLFIFVSCQSGDIINNLKTEYMTNPLGIDTENPRFSWQMSSYKYDMAQSGYRIVVSSSKKNLNKGDYLYDSGRINGDKSVGISCGLKSLKPSTKYWWRVFAWDKNGNLIKSKEDAWFETGLMNSGWREAKWIGSNKAHLSKYRSHYTFDFDVDVKTAKKENDGIAEFIWGVQDENNYSIFSADFSNSNPIISFSSVTDGKKKNFEMKKIWQLDPAQNKRHIRLIVKTSQYALDYIVTVEIDNKTISPSTFNISPYDKRGLKYLCRLWSIGYAGNAISGIKISDNNWGSELFNTEKDICEWTSMNKYFVTSPANHHSAPMLRKDIVITKPIKKARIYSTARGIYTLNINGEKVGEDYYNPGWTDYRYRIMYNTYDVTKMLKKGNNSLGAILGSGWWCNFSGFLTEWQDQYGTSTSLLFCLVVDYKDGTQETIVSDDSWRCFNNGPIIEDGLLNGVDYDARMEINGWNKPGFNDEGWTPAKVYPGTDAKIEAYVGSPVRKIMTLTAKSVSEPASHVYVYDMGQNMVGIPSIRIIGKKGQKITLNFGEMIYPETIPTDPVKPYTVEMYKQKKGFAYTENYRSALSTDRYICKGDKNGEIFEPELTSHGFRYIEIHGLEKPIPLEDVKGIVLESIGEQKSHFNTSNNNINRLFENIIWGEMGNFLSIPTDCPQRDERMGWMGDAQIFARTATYNMNVDQFYTRWMRTIRDNQSEDGNYTNYTPVVGIPPTGGIHGGGAMGWCDAGVIVPWQVYLQYSDLRILEEHYESMVRFMDYLEKRAVNSIQPQGGFGDWLALDGTPTLLTNTAYSAYDAQIMTRIAKILGKEKDAARFERMYNDIKETFNKVFVDENGYTFCPKAEKFFKNVVPEIFPTGAGLSKNGAIVNTQTSYVVPMQFGLFNDKNKPLAIKHLKESINKMDTCLTTGFIGTPYLNLVLSASGNDQLAYALFEQTSYPSWLYPVLQGATTIWERWNSYTFVNGFGPVDMNSFNHYSYGAIQEWMFSYMLGIEQDMENPGYKHFYLQPRVGGSFKFAEGGFESQYGKIESKWEICTKGVRYFYTIPANTSATLLLKGKPIFEKGADYVKKIEESTYLLPAGEYVVLLPKQ